MDLVRTLLVKVRDHDLPPGAQDFISYGDDWFTIEGHDLNQVVDNLRMLHDGGFVAGSGCSNCDFGLIGLTWQSAELLASIENPEVWTRTKAAAKKVGGVGFDLFIQIAKAEAKRLVTEKLGIPLS